MTTLASSTPLPLHNDIRAELEPDKAWKDALRAKIEDGLSSMIEDAKKNHQTELSKGTMSDARREAIDREYAKAINNIRTLAQDTFVVELERERQERRWAAGVNMVPAWNEALVQEQQDIMDRIKGTRKGSQSPSVAERSLAERPGDGRPVGDLSSSPSGYSVSSSAQIGPPRHLVKERRERSLDRLEQGLPTSQSLQPPPISPATPELQRQQEEKARRIMERKEQERMELKRQGKTDQENKRLRKEEEETKERLKEQERTRRMENQLLEMEHAEKERQDRERAEQERQERERLEIQHREWERVEKERSERQRQMERGILERQRLENAKKKEQLEKERKEKKEREEREERDRRQREEREERERREKEKEERERERREKEERKREKEEMEKQEMENARLDRERRDREHLARLEAARVKEEREQKERWKREEEEEERELEKTREFQPQRDWRHEYVRETQAHDRPQLPLNRDLSQSTDSEFSDTCDTDDLELLSPPPGQLPTVKQSTHELTLDSTISRSIDSPSRSSSTDRPAARSPPTIWKPSSVEDDVTIKLFSTELGRRTSVTSIKSTGTGGVRTVNVDEPIPERSDSEAEYLDRNNRYQELEDRQPTKPWERERRREYRKNSASDGPRGDESYVPHFPNARASHRSEDPRQLPPARDRYESEQNYRGLRYHRSEEIPNHPSSSLRAPLRRETSFYEEHDDKYHSSRSIRTRTSFEDRGGSYQPPPQARVPSRPSSTLNDERDYYDQGGYRSYPTPPSSATRPPIRDHMTPPNRYQSGPPYGYSSEPRSNTLKYAQQPPESPLSRRPSESRPSMNRGPSFAQNYSEEPSPLHASSSESYPRTYERAASASIPILTRQHRPPYGSEEMDGWRSWFTESPPFRREARREPERRDRYDQDRDDLQDTEYSGRSGREYELWHPDSYPYYGPHPEPLRRKGYSLRSPMTSHPGSYHDGPDHSFGGRDRTYEALYETDGLVDDMETEMEPIPRYRDVPRLRREDSQRSALLDEEERNRWEAEEWRRQMAEDRKRYPFEEEETQRREAMKRKESKRQATETMRLDDDTWQRGDELRRQAVEARRAREEAMRIAEEVRIKAEEATRKEEEAIKKEEEVLRRAKEARRKEEEAKLKEEEARKKEEEAKKKEEEAKKKEEEVHRQAEEARRKEEEVRRKEVAAKEEARRVREEAWKREQDMKYWEEELKQKEEQLQRREREIEAERKEEESRKEAERLQKQSEEEEQRRLEEQRKREDRFRYEQQQEEFRRREQEIHERRRQDSIGGSFPSSYASSSTYSARSYPSSSTTGVTGQTSGWGASSKPGTASKASSASAASKSRSNASFPTSTPSPHPPTTFDEADFKRRQEEFSQEQQERFRKEQLRFEETRQRTESSKLSSEQVLSILERHDRQWNILTSSTTSLHWGSIPWPMFFPPQNPDDITLSTLTLYLQSPLLPDREKTKPQKDRLKEMIKRWHPDRFETKYLPRIIEGDREKVKEGTGVVIRLLNELLTKVNSPGPFGLS